MNASETYRKLAVAPIMSATTAIRTGVACLEALSEHGPALIKHGLAGWQPGENGLDAGARFRDEALQLARESTDAALREMQRGFADFDEFTRAG